MDICLFASFTHVYQTSSLDPPGIIERLSVLFQGNPHSLLGFNTILPPGYRINVSVDPRDPSMITVTTPMDTAIPSSNHFGQIEGWKVQLTKSRRSIRMIPISTGTSPRY